jgi:hypothetical protein
MPGPRIYIPQEQVGLVITPGTGFHFCRLLRLPGLRPHGKQFSCCQECVFIGPLPSNWCTCHCIFAHFSQTERVRYTSSRQKYIFIPLLLGPISHAYCVCLHKALPSPPLQETQLPSMHCHYYKDNDDLDFLWINCNVSSIRMTSFFFFGKTSGSQRLIHEISLRASQGSRLPCKTRGSTDWTSTVTDTSLSCKCKGVYFYLTCFLQQVSTYACGHWRGFRHSRIHKKKATHLYSWNE